MHFNFNNTYLDLPEELFSRVIPAKREAPQQLVFNTQLAKELGLNTNSISTNELAELFSGNSLPADAASISQAYSGHQFGYFTMLGDGRAILLGEHITPEGNRFDIQFKGSGITPYSRRGDGNATLSSVLREYIYSEALHALKIPTTRSLSVTTTNEPVYREEVNTGAVLTRVAKSHIRFGTFEYAKNYCNLSIQKQLTDYTISRHFPYLKEAANPPLALLQKVMEMQIELVVNWMRVGFIHGVMNTDNMLLSGQTIDFGPCAFMNRYKSNTVFSSIDHLGRYSFENQPSIVLWNLSRFAESLLPQIDSNETKAVEKVTHVLENYKGLFHSKYQKMMFGKLGISNGVKKDLELIQRLAKWMEKYEADYTNTFVQLMYPEMKLNDCFDTDEVKHWVEDWKKRVEDPTNSQKDYLALMQENNPVYIPRNKIVEEVLVKATQGSLTPFFDLLEFLLNPYCHDNLNGTYMKVPDSAYDAHYKTYCGT